jgi:hypothetical protein
MIIAGIEANSGTNAAILAPTVAATAAASSED